MRGPIRFAAVIAALVVPGFALSQLPAGSPTEAAVAHLRTAVNTQRDGSHLPLLFSLRQFRDPSLRPLFERLVDHRDWQVQVHAALGLAESNASRRLEPQILARVSPAAQEAIIASAIDLNLLGVDEMLQVLSLDGVGALPRLMLHAELTLLKHEIDRENVRAMTEHEDLRVAGLASMLLAEHGDALALSSFRSRFEKAAPRAQRIALPWLLDAIRQYRLVSASEWLRRLYSDPTIASRDKQFIVLTGFAIDPVSNLDLWRDFLGDSPTYARCVRAGFMLLAAGDDAPADVYDELLRHQPEDDLLVRLAAAGRAVAANVNAAEPMIDLLELGHPRTTEWVMTTLSSIDVHQAERVYRHVLDQVQNAPSRGAGGQAERIGLAVTAAARLFETDPEVVVARLLDPGTEPSLQQALLLGMFETDSPRAGEAAAALEVVGVGREASLRLLLIARHADDLSGDDLRQLGIIAGGGGRVSDVLRVQAAWLYLKRTNQTDAAMAQLFP